MYLVHRLKPSMKSASAAWAIPTSLRIGLTARSKPNVTCLPSSGLRSRNFASQRSVCSPWRAFRMSQVSLTEEEKAHIFQPSPHHELRQNIYTSAREKGIASNAEGKNVETIGESEKMDPKERHEKLLERYYAMTGDPLEADGGRIVVHRGNPRAQLMIIGEAPGENEDKQGKPFVGRGGQLLDKIFQYGGFDVEEQVYFTNVAKRRPLNNRTPTPDECAYYMPFLMDEIAAINPKVIVLAGKIATQALLNRKISISKIRGTWFKLGEDGPDMMPIYHPAYLLRKPDAKVEMVVDIEEIRKRFMQLVPEEPLKPLKKP